MTERLWHSACNTWPRSPDYGRLTARRPGRWPVTILGVAFTLSLVLNDLAVARWWPRSEQRTAYQVLAQVPATGSVSAQDRYVPHLSLRTLVTVFPVELGRVVYVLVNLDTLSVGRAARGDARARRGYGDHHPRRTPGAAVRCGCPCFVGSI